MSQKKIAVQKTIYWNIENFTREFAVGHYAGHSFRSKAASLRHKTDEFRWYLSMYPNGEKNESTNHLFLCLCLELATTLDFDVQFEFCIMKPSGDVFKLGPFEKTGAGFVTTAYNLISYLDLFNENSAMISNNTLKLMCKLTLLMPKPESSLEVFNPRSCPFIVNFRKLFESSETSDMKLTMSDGKILTVHKLILTTRCSVFHRMFSSNMQEAVKNEVEIPDFDSETMNELLRFIYCNEVQNLDKVSLKLVYCAEKYEMLELKKICRDHIISIMKTDNIVEILAIAETISDMDLLTVECVKFLATNWECLSSEDRKMISLDIHDQVIRKLRKMNDSVYVGKN